MHLSTFESPDVENEFEDIDTYSRVNIYRHIKKT